VLAKDLPGKSHVGRAVDENVQSGGLNIGVRHDDLGVRTNLDVDGPSPKLRDFYAGYGRLDRAVQFEVNGHGRSCRGERVELNALGRGDVVVHAN
jgi:hypothetical protein